MGKGGKKSLKENYLGENEGRGQLLENGYVQKFHRYAT
jgi:hypothetical protein